MNTLQAHIAEVGALDGLTGYYGQEWKRGILLDHLHLAKEHGLRVTTVAAGTTWISEGTRVAVPLVCGELIWIDTEDGRIDGRCGLRLNHFACPRHGDYS